MTPGEKFQVPNVSSPLDIVRGEERMTHRRTASDFESVTAANSIPLGRSQSRPRQHTNDLDGEYLAKGIFCQPFIIQ
jgi:hypothetical protein